MREHWLLPIPQSLPRSRRQEPTSLCNQEKQGVGVASKGENGGLGWEAVWVEKRVSPLRGSRKAVSRFGRNDGVFVVEKKGIRVATLPSEMRGFFAALRMTT